MQRVQERLAGRDFSFWKWFWANMNLIKNYVLKEWQDGCVLVARSNAVIVSIQCYHVAYTLHDSFSSDTDSMHVLLIVCTSYQICIRIYFSMFSFDISVQYMYVYNFNTVIVKEYYQYECTNG